MKQSNAPSELRPTDDDVGDSVAFDEFADGFDNLSMFRRRCDLRRINHPARLYKYRAIPDVKSKRVRRRLRKPIVRLLLHNELWLASPMSFNDPFDGRSGYAIDERGDALREMVDANFARTQARYGVQLGAQLRDEFVEDPDDLIRGLENNHEEIIKRLGVCSLSKHSHNQLMWAHYANEHRGFCVQLSVAHDVRNLYCHEVGYSNKYPVKTDVFRNRDVKSDQLPFLRKSEDWADEGEWRIVEPDQVNVPRKFAPSALTALMFGLRTTQDDKDYITKLLAERERRHRCSPVVYEAVQARHRYRVSFRGAFVFRVDQAT